MKQRDIYPSDSNNHDCCFMKIWIIQLKSTNVETDIEKGAQTKWIEKTHDHIFQDQHK